MRAELRGRRRSRRCRRRGRTPRRFARFARSNAVVSIRAAGGRGSVGDEQYAPAPSEVAVTEQAQLHARASAEANPHVVRRASQAVFELGLTTPSARQTRADGAEAAARGRWAPTWATWDRNVAGAAARHVHQYAHSSSSIRGRDHEADADAAARARGVVTRHPVSDTLAPELLSRRRRNLSASNAGPQRAVLQARVVGRKPHDIERGAAERPNACSSRSSGAGCGFTMQTVGRARQLYRRVRSTAWFRPTRTRSWGGRRQASMGAPIPIALHGHVQVNPRMTDPSKTGRQSDCRAREGGKNGGKPAPTRPRTPVLERVRARHDFARPS